MPRGTQGYAVAKKNIKPDEILPSLEMINAINENLKGRPCVYPNNEAGIESFRANCMEYFKYLQQANENLDEKNMLIADVEGLCAFCGITRTTLHTYKQRSKAWAEMIDFFKNQIACIKKNLALHGKIPTVLAVFDLSNNHGYFNTSIFQPEQNSNVPQKEDDESTLEQRIADSGMVWDEAKKEWVYADK